MSWATPWLPTGCWLASQKMKLYKYRDLSVPTEKSLQRVFDILRDNLFWCASPATLNDPTEFIWECDYEPSTKTASLLANVLVQMRGRTHVDALSIATAAVAARRIEYLAKPIFRSMIRQCREEIGLACFATSNNNETMWKRYAGDGSGVCIEVDVPDKLLGDHLFKVEYPARKGLSIDQMLSASLDPIDARTVYRIALLSKPPCWAPEEEVRFVSRKQDVAVRITDSRISGITFGRRLASDVKLRLETFVESLRS